jgi:hypothetical protein
LISSPLGQWTDWGSLQDLLTVLGEIHAKGCDLYLHQQGIDTRTPSGKALFQMMGVFAEFERAMMVERVRSGLPRAREQGKQLGDHKMMIRLGSPRSSAFVSPAYWRCGTSKGDAQAHGTVGGAVTEEEFMHFLASGTPSVASLGRLHQDLCRAIGSTTDLVRIRHEYALKLTQKHKLDPRHVVLIPTLLEAGRAVT